MSKLMEKLKNIQPNTRMLILLTVAAAIVFSLLAVIQSYSSISEKKAAYDEVERKYNEQLLLNAEMQSLLEESDEEYIERIAREKLDMVYPGERVFISSSGN